MEATVVSALIAAAVSIVAAGLAFYSSRREFGAKLSELDLKRADLENVGKKLLAETEALRQNLMRDILSKRMAAYAALWKVFISYERNWLLEERAIDAQWASNFLRELNACNAEHGVFFSQQVYVPFFEYRQRLVGIVGRF